MQWLNFFHIYQPPAWDEAIIRRVTNESYRPVLSILEAHPSLKITMNITAALSEQLEALELGDVLDRFRALIARGQVELVGSAMYHPILPLLPADEIRRQIQLQEAFHGRIFGPSFRPRGFYCPEMAYAPSLDPILRALGYEWIILDEVCGDGTVGRLPIDRPYTTPGGLRVIFRNRHISDYLSFSSDLGNPADGLRAISEDKRSRELLITAMDGENLGHHRHGVEKLWEFLVTYPGVTTATISEFVNAGPAAPLSARAGSWSSQPRDIEHDIPYSLWSHPDNPVHRDQWALTNAVIKIVSAAASDPNYSAARRLLDRALASDRYWWASASPWWDLSIILRETQKLADAIGPLTSIPASSRNAVEQIVQQISVSVELWERTGLAKKRQQAYLEDTGDVRYMGGGQV